MDGLALSAIILAVTVGGLAVAVMWLHNALEAERKERAALAEKCAELLRERYTLSGQNRWLQECNHMQNNAIANLSAQVEYLVAERAAELEIQ